MKIRLIMMLSLGSLVVAGCNCVKNHSTPQSQPVKIKPSSQNDTTWTQYGGTAAGTRLSTTPALRPDTVSQLKEVWRFRTGDTSNGDGYFGRRTSFKATPLHVEGKLVFSTGFNKVFAIDAQTGKETWRYDPKVDFSIQYSEMFTSRGVSYWQDLQAQPEALCASRIYHGTLDARLIALDTQTGKPCRRFGRKGEIDLSKGVENFRRGEYSLTSPVTITNDTVIVGSSIGDNGGANLDSGIIRGFNARSGELLWAWDPIDRSHKSITAGAGNMWSVAAADPERGLVYIPTTSPSPDFYGGERPGDNANANSIVALDARSGKIRWRYQIVRHDLWDYDLASQPLLIDITRDDTTIPALVLATKMGFVFVLDRTTGDPVFPVEERPVPASEVPGEQAALTQRFPHIQLHPTTAQDLKLWDYSDDHIKTCQAMMGDAKYDGIFTPPSLKGTLLYPGNPGGTNWGSMAADTDHQIAFTVVNRLPTLVKLIPRDDFLAAAEAGLLNGFEAQYTGQWGTPYGMARLDMFNSSTSRLCFEGPWSELIGLDLKTGNVLWRTPLGISPGLEDHPEASRWGLTNVGGGGPLVSSGGLVFVATRFDRHLRAFNTIDGSEIWNTELPAEPHATPMAYQSGGRSYVVVAAGGSKPDSDIPGDYLIGYALASEASP